MQVAKPGRGRRRLREMLVGGAADRSGGVSAIVMRHARLCHRKANRPNDKTYSHQAGGFRAEKFKQFHRETYLYLFMFYAFSLASHLVCDSRFGKAVHQFRAAYLPHFALAKSEQT